jgi:threonine synthase
MVQQFDWEVPDWVVIPGGNLGNVAALGAGFELMLALGLIDRRPRICLAQAERAAPLYHAYQRGFRDFQSVQAGETEASAIRIGNPVSVDRAIRTLRAFDGVVEVASERELAEAAAGADRAGAYACPHTGVALAAVEKLAASGVIAPRDRVVVVSTANGLKFTSFKTRYHDSSIPDVDSSEANKPIELENDFDGVRRVVLGALD